MISSATKERAFDSSIEVGIEAEHTERTSAQVGFFPGPLGDGRLHSPYQRWYATYQEMLSDPTIAFARMLTVAPLVVAGWTYVEEEGAPEGAREFIQRQMDPWRITIMKQTMEGYVDYGWQPFEIVHAPLDGQIAIKKFKPLLQLNTFILVERQTGEFIGLRQYQDMNYNQIDLSVYDSLLTSIDWYGTQWYGRPLLENNRLVYADYKEVAKAAQRFDTKVAGSHWIVHYPIGKSPYKGVPTDNYDIAQNVLGALEAAGKISVPRKVANVVTDLNAGSAAQEDAWKIELITASGSTSPFIERSKYFDTLKVRGFGIPERAILEGQFGTKAESEAQADFAITNFEMRHDIVTQQINFGPVNLLLELNYGRGARDTIRVVPKPLVDEKRRYFQELYSTILTSVFGDEEFAVLDTESIRKMLGIPEKATSGSSLR